MKKFLFIILSFLFLMANSQPLKAGIEECYVPKGFYGSWGVISKLKSSDNPDIFNFESRDVWTLSGYGEKLILENLESGARSEIIMKEKNKDGKTLKFERQKTVNNIDEKIVYKETVSFVLDGDSFCGYDNFVIEKYTKSGTLISKNSANYRIDGIKIAGARP